MKKKTTHWTIHISHRSFSFFFFESKLRYFPLTLTFCCLFLIRFLLLLILYFCTNAIHYNSAIFTWYLNAEKYKESISHIEWSQTQALTWFSSVAEFDVWAVYIFDMLEYKFSAFFSCAAKSSKNLLKQYIWMKVRVLGY